MNDLEAYRQLFGQTWRATPDNYSSIRSMWLEKDGSGELVYAYGQTIYARIKCEWAIEYPGVLRLTYQEFKAGRHKGFVFDEKNRHRELNYTLTEEKTTWHQDVVPETFVYEWKLELSEPPWPKELEFPYSVPTVFYGKSRAAKSASR